MSLIDKWVAMRAVQGIDSVATLRDGDPVIRMSAVEHVLENLPETEPDTTTHDSIPAETGKNDGDGTSGNCISRQEALNLFPDDNLHWDTNEGYFAPHYAKTLLRNLPSAQPDIIRCKDCLMHGVCRFEQGLGLDGYCSQAKRRTDE